MSVLHVTPVKCADLCMCGYKLWSVELTFVLVNDQFYKIKLGMAASIFQMIAMHIIKATKLLNFMTLRCQSTVKQFNFTGINFTIL